ncbi:YafY family transcriptional regulator [Clostridiaceae bacterium UIB06]|uniref:YafY family transcriptional regulator n=1 Tax=Clostridium thailandense TaxID=2794346 RepID=A0A949TXJ2_9CLOT|nr:YafY family protein [Clostridium thailandense]MBV7272309.1 YafY family transcriptional regulator [Clostridium thailandense]MCH5136729.1 YafY family transcriptional regulator [Clostridiaceae bacterium UIB06]
MSKISHLLEMIITLQYKGLTTAADLAEALEVDKKTIYRYINSLNKANIPVHTKKGRYGGFYIDKEFYMKPSKLSEEELQALLMATQILTEKNGFVLEKNLQTAVSKIKNICINDNEELKCLNETGFFRMNEIGNLQDLEDKISKINYAINRGRSISINYFSLNRSSLTVKKVDAYNLLFREGGWYIIGYCHMNNTVETFKLSRIKTLKVTEEIYMIPRTFSLKEYLNNNWGVFKGEKIKVSIKFDKNVSDFIKNGKWHINQQIEDQEDGSILLNLYLDDTEEIKNWVMSLGKYAEIVEPKKLRDELKMEIEQIYKKY